MDQVDILNKYILSFSGAKSSENLLTLEASQAAANDVRHGDADSLSSNNSDAREWPSRPGRHIGITLYVDNFVKNRFKKGVVLV